MAIFAHSLPGQPVSDWEPLAHHLHAVGERAAGFAAAFGAEMLGRVAGRLHDIGKCSPAYQRYIRPPGPNRGPDHSTAGARAAVAEYCGIGRLMAFAIAGHHAGLMDGSGHEGKGNSLDHRLSDDHPIEPHDGWRDHVGALPDRAEMKPAGQFLPARDYPGFERAFLTRMIFSCLVDADRLETERFHAEARGEQAPARGGTIGRDYLDRVRAFMADKRRDDTPVNRLRAEILDHAIAKAALAPGLFTLTVPTGGGKTLASLSFALEHAIAHGLRRIVYVIPFTSIIEQTAQVFRDEVGLGEDAVLEHHSSFDWDKRPPADENDREKEGAAGLAKLRRDTENWDAPIIVTTGVQFWESLFAAHAGRARKLHNLANSVIILDEAQTLPIHLLRPCMAAIDELARNYGASVVLCTATQPALREIDRALPRRKGGPAEGFAIDDARELAPRPRELYCELKRVQVEWRRDPVANADIADRFAAQDRMLCIVNSRAHARDLFEAIRELPGARHLTTLMCARHRRRVLADARAKLDAGEPVRLVATSLIEAGVDIDFPEVWRAAAGLDSIAQAAGRCNREGRLDGLGRTVIFEPADGNIPRAIAAFYQAARPVLDATGDPLGIEAIHHYFRELYFQKGHEALDKAMLDGKAFSIIQAIGDTAAELNFPFSRIASAFRLIDDVMEPVLIPWDSIAKDALDTLRYADAPPAAALRRLQQYVVPVPAKARGTLLATRAAQAIKPEIYGDRFVWLEEMSQYDDAFGLRLDDPVYRSAERNIFS